MKAENARLRRIQAMALSRIEAAVRHLIAHDRAAALDAVRHAAEALDGR